MGEGDGEASLCGLARGALALVARARPDAWAEMTRALDGLTLRATLDGDMTLRSAHGQLREVTAPAVASIRVSCDRAAARDLVYGHATLLAAIRAGRVEVAGDVAALQRGLHAFEVFVGALLRLDEAEALRRAL
ncbi:MAG: hypothetical protein U0325_21415 [Polyangiales bacterium]